MGTPALIGLGGNLGDRRGTLDAALAAISATPGVRPIARSRYHETPPVGGPAGQGAYLNAAATFESDLDPATLRRRLSEIEGRLGRVRSARWGERTVDLDLLLFGDASIESPELTIPHPRMAVRRFVLVPAAEIAPDRVDPATRRSLADLSANLDRRPSVVVIAGRDRRPIAAGVRARLATVGEAWIVRESEILVDPRSDSPVDAPAATFAAIPGRDEFEALRRGHAALEFGVDRPAPRLGPDAIGAGDGVGAIVSGIVAACEATRTPTTPVD